VDVNLNLQHLNKNFMLKKVSQMNLAVAQNVGLPEKHKTETMAADIPVNHVKCSQLFVPLVEKKRLYLSNHQGISRYIAVIVTNHVHATIGNSIVL
jgi:hypothetical protein